jgi:hypothetical protein
VAECFELMERLELCADYTDLTGKELPEHIRKLPLPRLREAVRQAKEHGIVFGEPKTPAPCDNSSLMEWDHQDDKNGNAYGS